MYIAVEMIIVDYDQWIMFGRGIQVEGDTSRVVPC